MIARRLRVKSACGEPIIDNIVIDTITNIIIHCNHHLSSRWLKGYQKFYETMQPTDYSICRLREQCMFSWSNVKF